MLNSGGFIQYINGKLVKVSGALTGADGTAVVPNRTVARDRAIIPVHNSQVDLDKVGSGLTANDIGSAIKGYRIDLYKGSGKAVCAGFNNIMSVGACHTGQPNCPTSAVK